MSFVARAPIALLGLILVVSSLQASCGGDPDAESSDAITQPRDIADASPGDASDDSPDDRADGMSYGDGYGK